MTTKNVDQIPVKDEALAAHQLTAITDRTQNVMEERQNTAPRNNESNSDKDLEEPIKSSAEKLQKSEEKSKVLEELYDNKIKEIKRCYGILFKEEIQKLSNEHQMNVDGLRKQLEANMKHYQEKDIRQKTDIALLEKKIKEDKICFQKHIENIRQEHMEQIKNLSQEKSKLEELVHGHLAELDQYKKLLSDYQRGISTLMQSLPVEFKSAFSGFPDSTGTCFQKLFETIYQTYIEQIQMLSQEKLQLEKKVRDLNDDLDIHKQFSSDCQRAVSTLMQSLQVHHQDETDGPAKDFQEVALSAVVFGGPKPDIFPIHLTCQHSCVTLSYCFIWCLFNPSNPLCAFCLVKEATRKLDYVDQNILECKKTVDLFLRSQFLMQHRNPVININGVEHLNQALKDVTKDTAYGLLGFSYDGQEIGHCVAYWVTPDKKLLVFDAQRWRWWRESNYDIIKAVYCFEVITAAAQSLPRASCMLPVTNILSL